MKQPRGIRNNNPDSGGSFKSSPSRNTTYYQAGVGGDD